MINKEYIINSFNKNFSKLKNENIALYGLGVNSKTIIEHFSDFDIVGVIDGKETSGVFHGKPILSNDDIILYNINVIIIVAQMRSTRIIYERINKFCMDNNIELYSINGKNLFELMGFSYSYSSNYFNVSEIKLIEEIDSHEIISFDVFDTLIMRKTLYPTDVFDIVEIKAKQKNIVINSFREYRIKAETENYQFSNNIYGIYNNLQLLLGLSSDEKDTLLQLEIETERQVIIKRTKMVEIMEYALTQGKKVYLISDMYLPKNIMVEILNCIGICGFEDILISCDYNYSKYDGLFNIFLDKVKGCSYLHIGDNEEVDGMCAKDNDIDTFLIKKAVSMLELSTYKELLNYTQKLNDRIAIGLVIANVFNNPFALYQSNGKPLIDEEYNLAYICISTLITNFVIWLVNNIKNKLYDNVLFCSRDGYIIKKLYDIYNSTISNNQLTDSIYFYTSRILCTIASISDDIDIERLTKLPYGDSPEKMLETRFALKKEEITPFNKENWDSVTQYVISHRDKIIYRSNEIKINYITYMNKIGLKNHGNYGFVDFVSKGTCQYLLESFSSFKLNGLYFCRYNNDQVDNMNISRKNMIINSLYTNESVYAADSYLFENYFLLETIITSPETSVINVTNDGQTIHEDETRSQNELNYMTEMHGAIVDFFTDFIQMHNVGEIISLSLGDKLYSFKDSKYTNERSKLLDSGYLYDSYVKNKVSIKRQ